MLCLCACHAHLKCLGGQRVPNGMLQGLHSPTGGHVALSGPPHSPHSQPLFFPCVALVMPFSLDTLLELSMTLTRLSRAKSLLDPLVSPLLGEWVASSPLAKAPWYEATEVAQLPLILNKQIEAVKQYASVLFPAPDLIGLLMDLNVPKGGFWHVSEFMTRQGPRTPPQWASHSPAPSLHVTASWTHGRSWSSRLPEIDPCPWRIPPQAAALGRCNRGPPTSNRVHPLWPPSIGRGPSLCREEEEAAGHLVECGIAWVFHPDNPRFPPVDTGDGAHLHALGVRDVDFGADEGVVGTMLGFVWGGGGGLGEAGLSLIGGGDGSIR